MTTASAPAPGARRAALAFIFVTVLIDVLAFGLTLPVLPHLIEQFVDGDTARAAYWVGLFGTVFGLVQFVFSPIQGSLSDRYGPRPVSSSGKGVATAIRLKASPRTRHASRITGPRPARAARPPWTGGHRD